MGEVTEIILSLRESGDRKATEQLFALVYDQLKRMARKKLVGESSVNTLQPTALVNEAFLKLVKAEEIQWNDRLHFFRAAGQAMRRILIDRAKHNRRLKRGGKLSKKPLDAHAEFRLAENSKTRDEHDRLLDLDAALQELELIAPDRSELVRLHFFAGLTLPQCGELLQVSTSTIERQWRCTKAWLRQKMV